MTAACRTTVLQLFKAKQIDKLSKFVADCSPNELQETMLSACGAPDFGHLAKAMFKALEVAQCDESAAAERRRYLVQAAIRVMARTEVCGPICSEAMSLLSIEVSNLSDSALVSVFDTLLEVTAAGRIASPAVLDLLDKLLTRDKLGLADRLCTSEWHRDNALPLVACLAELGAPLTGRERDSLVRKSICCLRRVDISNLAGLLYHAFLFASKAGLLRLVICEVVEFFAELEGSNEKENSQDEPDAIHAADANEEDIIEAEGTVLVHLLYTIRLSPSLSAELLKVLRSLPLAQLLRPFSLALYFVLVSARTDEDMHRPLRLIVTRYYQDRCLRSESIFLRSFPDPLGEPSGDPVIAAFDIVATRAGRQWDNIVPGLVGFAFSCLEVQQQQQQQITVSASSTSTTGNAGIAAALALNRLGRELLVRLYRRAEAARETILSEAVALLLTTGGSRPLAALLRTLIARYPTLALQQQEMLRANLDCLLATLPEAVAVTTVASLIPLLRWSSRLRDSLIMCLRKCLYARQEAVRRMALRSLLLLLRHFKMTAAPAAIPASSSSSQTVRSGAFRVAASFASQQSSSHSSSQSSQTQQQQRNLVDVHLHGHISGNMTNLNESLCLEIVGMVNRIAGQMPQFLSLIYEELPQVCTSNPRLLEPFLGHLLSRLDRLMPSDRLADLDQAPVDFSRCFGPGIGGGVALLEPLDQLLSATQRLVSLGRTEIKQEQQQQQQSPELVDLVNRADSILSNASARFASAELEELEVDASSEYCGVGNEAVRVCRRAALLVGSFEALMLHEMSAAVSDGHLPDRLVALYRQRRLLCEVVDKKRSAAAAAAASGASAGGGGGGGRKAAAAAAAATSTASVAAPTSVGLAWQIQPDNCGQFRLDETCQMLCRALTASSPTSTSSSGASSPVNPETRADLSQFLLERARQLLPAVQPHRVSYAAVADSEDHSNEDGDEIGDDTAKAKQLAAIRQLCKVSLSFYGHSVKRLSTNNNAANSSTSSSSATDGAGPASATVHRCVHRVMQAALSLASAISERWTGRQLNSVSINSQSLAENMRHWTSALVQTGESRHGRDLAQLAGLLYSLSPGDAYLQFVESLLRSEAVANGALRDDAASTRTVAALMARNCVRHHMQPERHLMALAGCLRHRLGDGDEDAGDGGGGGGRRRQRRDGADTGSGGGAAFACVSRRTVDSVLQALVGELSFALDELDWLLSASGASSLPLQSVESFRSVAVRFSLLSELVLCLASMALKPGNQTGLMTRLATRHFRLLASLARCLATGQSVAIQQILQSPDAYADLERLVQLCGGELAPKIYDRVLQSQVAASRAAREAAEEAARQKKDKKRGKKNGGGKKLALVDGVKRRGGVKVDRDATAVPQLVYSIEQWEKALMQLCRRRSLGLMLRVRRAASRDFRIRLDEVQQALRRGESVDAGEETGAPDDEEAEIVEDEAEDEDEDEDSNEADEEGGDSAEPETVESTEPPRKRARVQKSR